MASNKEQRAGIRTMTLPDGKEVPCRLLVTGVEQMPKNWPSRRDLPRYEEMTQIPIQIILERGDSWLDIGPGSNARALCGMLDKEGVRLVGMTPHQLEAPLSIDIFVGSVPENISFLEDNFLKFKLVTDIYAAVSYSEDPVKALIYESLLLQLSPSPDDEARLAIVTDVGRFGTIDDYERIKVFAKEHLGVQLDFSHFSTWADALQRPEFELRIIGKRISNDITTDKLEALFELADKELGARMKGNNATFVVEHETEDGAPLGMIFPMRFDRSGSVGAVTENYLHGSSTSKEQARLAQQADFLKRLVHTDVSFPENARVLEIGCGSGAQSEILLTDHPTIKITGIDIDPEQVEAASQHLSTNDQFKGRFEGQQMNAEKLTFQNGEFDGAFISWVLEHVSDPAKVVQETTRVLASEAPVHLTEVINSTFFQDPHSPHTETYWEAYNQFQRDHGGDPDVGAKLRTLLHDARCTDVEFESRSILVDKSDPVAKEAMFNYWRDLFLSAKSQLLAGGYVTTETVTGMQEELDAALVNDDSRFYCSVGHARAKNKRE